MNYKIEIVKSLEKRLRRFPKKDKTKIIEKIDSLSENPRPKDSKKLQGNKKPPLYRIRLGIYRIVYTVKDDVLLVLVVDVGHRKDIYR